ncbi:MAG: hypothetical protein V9E94_04205 [Microthrixaceae bacterium]
MLRYAEVGGVEDVVHHGVSESLQADDEATKLERSSPCDHARDVLERKVPWTELCD